MGGVCGFIGESDKSLLKKMSDAISHRGPYVDYFIDKDVNFSSREIDKKNGLATNEDGKICVAFDGKIYNYEEIKNELILDKHYIQHEKRNSELIAHLYEKYGGKCANKIRGEFVFAIWDSYEKKFFLARDRIGEKSIFYTSIDDLFFFSSEIKSLLCLNKIKKGFDIQSLDYFFSWGHVPPPNTMFANIKKVPPSHFLIYKNKKIILKKYWELNYSIINNRFKEDEWCQVIYNMLLDSVNVRLKKEPMGILLGGLDSSTLASIITRLTDEPLKSFTLNFEDKEYNEVYTKKVSEWLEIENYEHTLYSKDLIRIIPKLVYIFDDLKVDLAPTIPTYLSLEYAKKHIKTIFTADGADCLFWSWGWNNSRLGILNLFSQITHLREISKKYISPIIKRRGNIITIGMRSLNNNIKTYIKTFKLTKDFKTIYDWQYYNNDEIKELLGRNYLVNIYTPFLECLEYPANEFKSKINRMRLINKAFEIIGGWGIERLGDICSNFSLELRTPFEDYKLKEISVTIPPALKQPNDKMDKYLFRKTILKYSLLPKDVIIQRKWGFGWGLLRSMPNWFRGELKEFAEQTILEGINVVKPILKEKAILKYYRKGSALQILSLLIFILWYRRFFSE